MAHDDGLPQTGDNQEIDQAAQDCLVANRPRAFRLTQLAGPGDVGFDYQVQLVEGQQVMHPFRLQLKGTRSPIRSADHTFISIGLKVSTLRYFDNTNEPVLLALCDLSIDPETPEQCPVYYVWVQDELERIQIASIPRDQQEAILRVPTANRLRRDTDLFPEVRRRHRVSRAGHTLDAGLAALTPSIPRHARVALAEDIARNLGSRGAVFAHALAEPVDDIWVNPPRGSVAWLLTQARSALNLGALPKCNRLLSNVASHLEAHSGPQAPTPMERAEYWYLRGRTHISDADDVGAATAFRAAITEHPLARYWAAWAESELRKRFRIDVLQTYVDLIEQLPESPEPELLAIRARLHAAGGEIDQAFALIESIDGPERLATKAIVLTMVARTEEALQVCMDGLALEHLPDNTALLFRILRARARFDIAMRPSRLLHSADLPSTVHTTLNILPPSGPIGIDPTAIREAWADIEDAVAAVEDVQWCSNAAFVVDIWAATASMLGRQSAILPRLLSAARLRPHQVELQRAAEAVAAQCGKFVDALEVNGRIPNDALQSLRRVTLLHELGRHQECIELMATIESSVERSHPLFGAALSLAAESAGEMARPDLIQRWRESLLKGDTDQRAHAATLDFFLAQGKPPEQRGDPLVALLAAHASLGHPRPTTLTLFDELDVRSPEQANQFLPIAARLRHFVRLAPPMAHRMAIALTTLAQWDQLLALCEESAREFDPPGRLRAFHALALDRLGKTDGAIEMLQSMLQSEEEDGLALDTYVNIMVRWGFTAQARSAAERILSGATDRQRRADCVRLLFMLEHQENPASRRLVDLAFRMGDLARHEDEVEEGIFLSMAWTAILTAPTPLTEHQNHTLQSRAAAYFERYPNSQVFRRLTVQGRPGSREWLASMRSALGITEEQEQQRAKAEAQLRSGELLLPFSWRPRLLLANVQDVVLLWELAKGSTRADAHVHLQMAWGQWVERPFASWRSRVPLFDLVTLLVLDDLELLDAVFAVFPEIAIPQAVLYELTQMSHGLHAADSSKRCRALLMRLREHLPQIVQPPWQDEGENLPVPRSSQALRHHSRSGEYILFCDDWVFTQWALDTVTPDALCTLDFLCGLEEAGRLTTEQVAKMLTTLCAWHVGVVIPFRFHWALIPKAVHAAPTVRAATSLLREADDFRVMSAALWAPDNDFVSSVRYVGEMVRLQVQDLKSSTAALGAFVAVWLDHALARPESQTPAQATASTSFRLLVHVVLLTLTPGGLPIEAAQRIWWIYWAIAEHILGPLSPSAVRHVTVLLARNAAALDTRTATRGVSDPPCLGKLLMMGLVPGSAAWVDFASAYQNAKG